MWVEVIGVAVEFNRQQLSSIATVVCVFGILVFFFLTEMAIAMFCGSWFLFGVLGIEIRLTNL